jgi:hypothetical protein
MRLLVVDWVEAFGTISVTAMVVFYALETRGSHYVLLFACACAASGTYAALIGAWPFAGVESIWAVVAARRWARVR